MAAPKARQVSARDHYEELYRTELSLEAAWLRYGANEKANSVEHLLSRNGICPRTMLELGCGTGAIIAECQRRGLASEFTAIDYSSEAIEYLQSRSAGIRCMVADIADPAFKLDQTFDVVVLSHVLEHLEQPQRVLKRIVNGVRCRHLVVEVPLEDLPVLRLISACRDRARNPAGHVQFFTEASFGKLLGAAALELLDARRYVPVLSPEMVKLVCHKDKLAPLRAFAKWGTASYMPRLLKPLWERMYYAHYAVLCRPVGNHCSSGHE
jgi:SAM-dependent methyltransferase